jgi:hypothetical protein
MNHLYSPWARAANVRPIVIDRNVKEWIFQKESCWKDGALSPYSLQQYVTCYLEARQATFIIDEDENGETADVLAIEETDGTGGGSRSWPSRHIENGQTFRLAVSPAA